MMSPWFGRLVCFVFILLGVVGCLTFPDKAKEGVEFRKKNYAALQDAVESHKLIQGTSAAQIRQDFGDPDDNYSSGSSSGKMEIWTYSKILNKSETDAIISPQEIRLYFDGGKLIDWRY